MAIGIEHQLIHAVRTPPSSAGPSTTGVGNRPHKRVEWSPWTHYHRAPSFETTRNPPMCDTVKPLPPSRERPSSKSILKPSCTLTHTTPPSHGDGLTSTGPETFAAMLESIVQQLAGGARCGRIDAYRTLVGSTKYFQEMVGTALLKEEMGRFQRFLRRDLLCNVSAEREPDIQLVLHALKFLMILTWTPSLATLLNDGFTSVVLSQALSAIKRPETPKVLVTHYMHMLGYQSFGPRVVTMDRSFELITALDAIEIRFRGNRVLSGRLLIYEKLIRQARMPMLCRATQWIRPLFSGLLSNVAEIRSRAISLGIQASLELGDSPLMANALIELFVHTLPTGQSFAEYIEKRLKEMTFRKSEGTCAAQIWSIPIMMLRGGELKRWDGFKSWLLVLQRCFNSNDLATKLQANIAWTRLIYALNLDDCTDPKLIRILRQPIRGQLRRKSSDLQRGPSRQMALSILCCLLYYALRPAANHQQYNLYWEEYVEQCVNELVLRNPIDTSFGCRILNGLFAGPQSGCWTANRANENGSIKPEELPKMDPKWIRSNTSKILRVVEVALGTASWTESAGATADVKRMWQSFVMALAEAGSKEVTISHDHIDAIAALLDFFGRVWHQDYPAMGVVGELDQTEFHTRFGFLVQTALEALGGHCFTESLVIRDKNSALYHRSSDHSCDHDAPMSPAVHLFRLFDAKPDTSAGTNAFYDMIKSILIKCGGPRSSGQKRLQFFAECTLSIPRTRIGDTHAISLFNLLAELAIEVALTSEQDSNAQATDRSLGLAALVDMLSPDLPSDSDPLPEQWEPLLRVTIEIAKRKLGDQGAIAAVITPLLQSLDQSYTQNMTASLLERITLLEEYATPPRVPDLSKSIPEVLLDSEMSSTLSEMAASRSSSTFVEYQDTCPPEIGGSIPSNSTHSPVKRTGSPATMASPFLTSVDLAKENPQASIGLTRPTWQEHERGGAQVFVGSSPTPARRLSTLPALSNSEYVPFSSSPGALQASEPPSSPPHFPELDALECVPCDSGDICSMADGQKLDLVADGLRRPIEGNDAPFDACCHHLNDGLLDEVAEDADTPDTQLLSDFQNAVDSSTTPTTPKIAVAHKQNHSTGESIFGNVSLIPSSGAMGSNVEIIDLTGENDLDCQQSDSGEQCKRVLPNCVARQSSSPSAKRKRSGEAMSGGKRSKHEASVQASDGRAHEADKSRNIKAATMYRSGAGETAGCADDRLLRARNNSPYSRQPTTVLMMGKRAPVTRSQTLASLKPPSSHSQQSIAAIDANDSVELGKRRLRSGESTYSPRRRSVSNTSLGMTFDSAVVPAAKRRKSARSPSVTSSEDLSTRSNTPLNDLPATQQSSPSQGPSAALASGELIRTKSSSTTGPTNQSHHLTSDSARRSPNGTGHAVSEDANTTDDDTDRSPDPHTPQKSSRDAESSSRSPDPLEGAPTPRTILRRLQQVLKDVRGMIFPSLELRMIDNVIFDIRRETFRSEQRT